MKELPKKWRVLLAVALFVVPFFMILRGIGTENSGLIVLGIWVFLLGFFTLTSISPQFAKDGSKIENRMSFLQACLNKEVWKHDFKRSWAVDLCSLFTCVLLKKWGLPWGGVLGVVCIMLFLKIDQSRRELGELRSQA